MSAYQPVAKLVTVCQLLRGRHAFPLGYPDQSTGGHFQPAQAAHISTGCVVSRYGGPDAAPVSTDGPLPETSDLVAGWYMIDVESHERAVEIAAYISSEPGPGGEPLCEWIDVREIMSGAPSED